MGIYKGKGEGSEVTQSAFELVHCSSEALLKGCVVNSLHETKSKLCEE